MFLDRDPAIADPGRRHQDDDAESITEAGQVELQAPASTQPHPGVSTDVKTRTRRRSNDEIARLVARAADGDQQAWNALVHQFAGLVWAITRAHRLGNADAAEVAQLTWLRLVEHIADLREPGHVGAWLATTARRESLRVLRESKRNVLTDDDGIFEAELTDPGLDGDLLTAERNHALWRSFARLPLRDRELLRLLTSRRAPSYDEIAAELEMPIGSIGPTRARALERLRRELERAGTLTGLT